MRRLLLVISSVLMACQPSQKNGEATTRTVPSTKIITDHLAYPWEILWGPDEFIWMTERSGRVSRVNPANGEVIPLLTISEVESRGEGGLLGMALHPQFASNPFVYLAYNYNGSDGYREKIVRFQFNGATLVSPTVLLDHINASSIHNGCRLLIREDKLYITTGDASDQSSAQNTDVLNGKILRINLDGSIPSDNPIPGNPVWTWGHRNAQGLVKVGSRLFSSEHGPESDDEINIIEKGKNYGWPKVKGKCDIDNEAAFCTANHVQEPIQIWTPTSAVCGLDYYDHDLIPEWRHCLLLATLKNSRLYVLKLNESQSAITASSEYYESKWGRLRDICVSPEGKVYICTSNGDDDKVIEISK